MKRFSAGYEKNREALAELLGRIVRAPGTVLEIGSGTGQHAAYFAAQLPSLEFVPSEKDPALVESIQAWRAEAALPNLGRPRTIDVTDEDWDAPPVTAVLAIDLAHATPWSVTVGLLGGAARILPAGGALLLYGPFRRGGAPRPPALDELDAALRRQAPYLGVRDLDEVTALATRRGLRPAAVHELPGHNVMAVFRR